MGRCTCGAPLVAGVMRGIPPVCWSSGYYPRACERYKKRRPHYPTALSVERRQRWITRVRRTHRAQKEV